MLQTILHTYLLTYAYSFHSHCSLEILPFLLNDVTFCLRYIHTAVSLMLSRHFLNNTTSWPEIRTMPNNAPGYHHPIAASSLKSKPKTGRRGGGFPRCPLCRCSGRMCSFRPPARLSLFGAETPARALLRPAPRRGPPRDGRPVLSPTLECL